MAKKEGSGSDEIATIVFRDSSKGELGETEELGYFRQLVVAVVEEVTDGEINRVKRQKDARLQPRNWHLSEGDPFSGAAPELKDRRLSIALISDYEHDFPGWKLDQEKKSPYYDDWDFKQKSTRIVDYRDPKGRTALFAQLCKVVDDHHQQYSAALVMSTEIGNHEKAGSGLLWDDNASQTGKLATVFILNRQDIEGAGRDGHPYGLLGVRTDTHFEWTTDYPDTLAGPHHGRIKFDTTDVADWGVPTKGQKYKMTLRFDSSVAGEDSALGHEDGQWRPWVRIPQFVPQGGLITDGPNMSEPGDGGGTTIPGSLVLPVWETVPTDTIPEPGRFTSIGVVDDGGGGRTIYLTDGAGSWNPILDGGGGGGAFDTGPLTGRPGTPSAVGEGHVATDKFDGPSGGTGGADPTVAIAVGINDALTWGYLALVNGWPQTVSSNWTFSGSPRVSGDLTKSGSGTIDANKLVTKVVATSPSTGKALIYNGTQFAASASLGVTGGGTGLSALTGTYTILYTSAANTLVESGAPSTDKDVLQYNSGSSRLEFGPVPIQAALDTLGSAQGDILFRGASGWTVLAPGTSGYVLQTNGAGADPSWAAASGGGATPALDAVLVVGNKTLGNPIILSSGDWIAGDVGATSAGITLDLRGGAGSGTDKDAGGIILNTGDSTGLAKGQMVIKMPPSAYATSSSTNTAVTVCTIKSSAQNVLAGTDNFWVINPSLANGGNSSSGTIRIFSIAPTVTYSGTATGAYEVLVVDVTDAGSPTGSNFLAAFKVGGTRKFSVRPNGQCGVVTMSTTFKSTQTGNATLDDTASVWPWDTSGGAHTATLPDATTVGGRHYWIKLVTGGNALTVATTSSQTIDGSTTFTIAVAGTSLHVASDGSNWVIL